MAGISKKRRKELEELETKDTKYCSQCKKVKPLFEFPVRSTGRKSSWSYCIDCHNENELQRKHGITLGDYDKLLEKQNSECKICKTKIPGGRGRFHIDHDHSTSKIRGLLCHKCNTFLGLADDDIKILVAAVQYLIDSRR